ncbi:MAG: NADH-quinone oxidoreductase subunit NuoK [Pseudomonadota bacterium]|jgi:NADH-quinone oxidoreductase subunit K|nr:NADH-quinone oxidoreductase subunit NuoK [Pseudomonadota bacterium]NLX32383.1 NADH-quinone oxidoreductase subunit NuoK [Deltaproteobacteria bacterium]HNU85597.1 NADH-quinone oxidoreductase subunit NuoK [Syntrophales bacterium]HNZ35220.1 NADH-quinone oxidoreductase subunit NuoK [Syntrophales bacterium]HOF73574.1 NADH-quinone oxidoreductase subunit NuoK [Syntrophales bacterium]
MSLEHVVGLGIVLFAVGAAGFFIRSNALVLLLCVELMLNAVNLILVGFSRYLHGTEGQVFVFMIMTVAAAEAAVGLAILVALYRLLRTLDMSRINLLKG